MRKLFFGLPVFITAFILGYVTAHVYLPRLFESNPTVDTATSAPIPEPPVQGSVEPPNLTTAAPISDQLETIDEVNDGNLDSPPTYSMKLLETGEDGYEYSDVPAKNGETWLGLFEENGKYSVRSTKLRISKDANMMVKVDVPGSNKPIFLLKNAPVIREGRVSSIFRGFDDAIGKELENRGITVNDRDTGDFSENFEQTFKLGGETYTLKAGKAKDKDGNEILALFLFDGRTRQVLHTGSADYGLGYLYWVGDIDHDGKPDIYCFLRDGDENGSSVLFLSSKAEKGKLVKKVAEYWLPGC